MRDFIVTALDQSLERTDTDVIAFTIMRNHFHLVIRQGYEPLDILMSSFMRRIALRVQKNERHCGHVFEKRFWLRTCATPTYLRNSIVYVHRNPLKARLCTSLDDYAWSSHNCYASGAGIAFITSKGLELFAENAGQDAETTRLHYLRYMEWRRICLELRKESPATVPPLRPSTAGGDAAFKKSFTATPPKEKIRRPDLRDIVIKTIADLAPGLPLDFVQDRCGNKALVALRKEVVRRSLEHDFAGIDIARWLRISPQSVSRIKNQLLCARYSACTQRHS